MLPKGHNAVHCACVVCTQYRERVGVGAVERRQDAAQSNGVRDCGHGDCILCNPDSGYNQAMRKWREGKAS